MTATYFKHGVNYLTVSWIQNSSRSLCLLSSLALLEKLKSCEDSSIQYIPSSHEVLNKTCIVFAIFNLRFRVSLWVEYWLHPVHKRIFNFLALKRHTLRTFPSRKIPSELVMTGQLHQTYHWTQNEALHLIAKLLICYPINHKLILVSCQSWIVLLHSS